MTYEELITQMKKDPKLSERDKLLKERNILREALENIKVQREINSLRNELKQANMSLNMDESRTIKPTCSSDEAIQHLINELFGGR